MNPHSAAPIDGAISAAEASRLAEAFQLFNRVSDELSQAYSSLQGQVVGLTERMHLLQEVLPVGVLVVDGNGCVEQLNQAAQGLLGSSLGDLVGQAWSGIATQLLKQSELPGEFWLGAEQVRVALTVSALDSVGGHIVLLHDITEAHRLKVQAERHDRLAAMGEMAAQVAHQLRTPLAAALLYAGNLENPDLPEQTRISVAQKTVARLKALERLIQDMLLFARGEALGREVMSVGDVVDEVAAIIEPLARQQGISFHLPPCDAALDCTANRKELTGALANLLENALNAVRAAQKESGAENGEIALESRADANTVQFIVRDNGKGMEPALLARLFEPFFTTRAEGTGLGLAIARGVARAHGGGIEVSSEPGRGTQFIFSIARHAGPVAEV